MRADAGRFGVFGPAQDMLRAWTGRDLDLLLGPRAVRLWFAGLLSGGLYFALVLALFRPTPDDRLILAALKRWMPRPVRWVIDRRIGSAARPGRASP